MANAKGKLQRACLKLLREHEKRDESPTSVRFLHAKRPSKGENEIPRRIGATCRCGTTCPLSNRTLSRHRRMTEPDPQRSCAASFAVLRNDPHDVVG